MKESSNYQIGHIDKKNNYLDNLMDIFLSMEHKISVANKLVDDRISRKFKMIEFVRNGFIVLNKILRFNYE